MSSSKSLAALRAYVCAPGQAGGANQAESTVWLNVEHVALKATRFAELRLDKHVRKSSAIDSFFLLSLSLSSLSLSCFSRSPAFRCFFFSHRRSKKRKSLRLSCDFETKASYGGDARQRNHF